MRQIRSIDEQGYVTELWMQAEDTNEDGEPIGYPELGEYEIATPIPEGLYEPVRWGGEEWVSEISETELFEMAYREKHRELVQAATQEFVNEKPGYTETERVLQSLRDMHGMIRQLEQRLHEVYPDAAPIEPLGYAGDDNNLTAIFDTLYGKLVMLEQTRQTRDRSELKGVTWKS